MQESNPSAALPGVVRQVGYVVADLDQAVSSWLSLGIGPWFVMRGIAQHALYRGEPCEVTLSVAFANTGELQVELIHQEGDTPSIYQEFRAAGRGDFHQLAWWAEDFEAALKSAEAAGWPVVWSGGGGDSVSYAYFEPPAGPAAIVEIMELNAATVALADLVRSASVGWDGSDPIRTLG